MRTETLDGMGLWGTAQEKPITITMVFDPIAGAHIHWQSDSKTATIMPMPQIAIAIACSWGGKVSIDDGDAVAHLLNGATGGGAFEEADHFSVGARDLARDLFAA